MAASVLVLYGVALVVGLGGAVYLGKATSRPSIRLLGGAAAGSGVGASLEYGAGYSFIQSAMAGSMGIMGYFFIASLAFLLFVWAGNLALTKATVIR